MPDFSIRTARLSTGSDSSGPRETKFREELHSATDMSERTFVILGAGLAGVPIAHYLLKNVASKDKNLRIVLVSPNTDHYWNLASVRGVVPGQMDDEKLFTPIQDGLTQYSPFSYEHVADACGRTKQVYLVHSGDLPLQAGGGGGGGGGRFQDSVRRTARAELEALGVRVLENRVVSRVWVAGPRGAQRAVEVVSTVDGAMSTVVADAYLPAIGGVPNTGFVPARLLDDRGRVVQDATLRVRGYDDVFCVGDCGAAGDQSAMSTREQMAHVAKLLERVLLEPLKPHKHPSGRAEEEFRPKGGQQASVTLGKSRGTGQIGSFKVFSFMVSFAKGKHLGTDFSKDLMLGKKSFM
ncbi:hypothetical protein F5Y15DRAFT_326295 [Xylariaceae sp. FL0016]|nr:hypothetical protein F5Y15DRAFT_326295 [Xylariaceae sp. FL0016]